VWGAELAFLTGTATAQAALMCHLRDAGKARPRLGMLGMPLAMMASLLLSQWWTLIPLTVAAWWWAQRDWPWYWLLALLRGIVGFGWSILAVLALSTWPHVRPLAGAAWIGATGIVMAASAYVEGRRD
jgi:hypothetical protein